MTPYELRNGATGERAIEMLRNVAMSAGNLSGQLAGRSEDEYLNKYLGWTEEAERQLGNVFPAEVVSDLLHTSNYWVLRASSGSSPRIVPIVLGEVEKRGRTLSELEQVFKLEVRRWEKPNAATLAVLDTNMFLQEGEPFHEIDWPNAVDSRIDHVRIVIPLVVIHELDRLKRQGNNTTRTLARTSLRWLYEHLPMRADRMSAQLAAGFPSTTVEVYVQDVSAEAEDVDGIIIRFARQLGRVSNLPTRLVTRDLSMRLRATALGVNAVQLPD